jgi:predicted transcriptional regulator
VKRTTIKLPDEVDAKLRFEAEVRGITISELTREAIETHLGMRGRQRFLKGLGSGESDGSGIASGVDEVLEEEGFGTFR